MMVLGMVSRTNPLVLEQVDESGDTGTDRRFVRLIFGFLTR